MKLRYMLDAKDIRALVTCARRLVRAVDRRPLDLVQLTKAVQASVTANARVARKLLRANR